MEQVRQAEMAEAFRALHHGREVLLLPNAWDAMSARLLVAAGFEAVATTSAGVAWALGHADVEQAPWPEVLAATARIVRAANVPVTADIEGGFAATPAAVGRHVAEAIRAGVVGVNLEDSHKGALRPVEEAAARYRAARAAADRAGVPIVLNARCDVMIFEKGAAEDLHRQVIGRCRAYVAAGADSVYPFGLVEPQAIAAVAGAVGAPVNVTGRPGLPDAATLGRMGVARITIGSGLALKTMGDILGFARQLHADGRFDALATDFHYPEAQALFS